MSKTILAVDGSAHALLRMRSRVLKEIVKSGHQVVACGAFEDDTSLKSTLTGDRDALRQGFRDAGMFFHDIAIERHGMNPLRDLRTLWQLYRLMRKYRPEIVLTHSVKSSLYGMLAARLAGVPGRFALMTGLGYLFESADRGVRRVIQLVAQRMLRVALAQATRVFFQNNDDRELFLSTGTIRSPQQTVLVNGSGVDLHDFSVVPLPKLPLTFLMIGRLQYAKGVIEYVEAARRLKQQYPAVRFQLVGPSDSHPTAVPRHMIDEWLAEGFLEYLGGVPDVRPYLASCHVFVLPSYREGVSRSAIEALATGRAVIMSDAPGCRETVIDGENGFKVPVKDAEALAAAMRRFIDQPELLESMGQRSRKYAEERFDVNQVVRTMRETMQI
jgi:glycosyltransferase involved in cell wall biosynthesis